MHTFWLYMALGGGVVGGEAAGPALVTAGQVQARPPQLMITLDGLPADAPVPVRQQHLDRLLRDSGLPAGIQLRWLRPLAVGGEVVQVEGLAPGQLPMLVQVLGKQPGVRHVEVDGRMQIGPGPRLPTAGMQRE